MSHNSYTPAPATKNEEPGTLNGGEATCLNNGLTLAEWRSCQQGSVERLILAFGLCIIMCAATLSLPNSPALWFAIACGLWGFIEASLPDLREVWLEWRAARRKYVIVTWCARTGRETAREDYGQSLTAVKRAIRSYETVHAGRLQFTFEPASPAHH